MKSFGGQTMAGTLRRVLVCNPQTARWDNGPSWRELGYLREPAIDKASEGHTRLVRALEQAGAEVLELPVDDALSLDAVYVHDASFPTDHGMILMHMGKPTRRGEPEVQGRWFEALDIPVLGRIEPPGLTEAGELERRGFHLIPIEADERDALCYNVLALGEKNLLAIAENEKTNARLENEGFEVSTYPGSEISLNGSGGPTCLTRPLLRG